LAQSKNSNASSAGGSGPGYCEIRSLGQERENLKLFRNKLKTLASLTHSKLSAPLIKEVKALVQEYKSKNYVLTQQDTDTLKALHDKAVKSENFVSPKKPAT